MKYSMSMLPIYLLFMVPISQAQRIQPPYLNADSSPMQEVVVSVGQHVEAHIGIEPDTAAVFEIDPPIDGMTIEATENGAAARIRWRPMQHGEVPVRVRAYIGGELEDEFEWEYHVGPFNIRELVGTSTWDVNIQENYNTINLMVFLLGDTPFQALYATRVADILPGFTAGIAAARENNLLTRSQHAQMSEALQAAAEILEAEHDGKPHPLLDSTIRDHFENDYLNDERAPVQALYEQFKKLAGAGLDIPFVHGLKRDAFANEGYQANMTEFLDAFLAAEQWGELTELSRYTTGREHWPNRDFSLLKEAVQRGIFLQSREHVVITPVRDEPGETKNNSMVCGMVFTGADFEEACFICQDPPRQTYCSIATPGVCSLSSDWGPCDIYPPQ